MIGLVEGNAATPADLEEKLRALTHVVQQLATLVARMNAELESGLSATHEAKVKEIGRELDTMGWTLKHLSAED
jgi:hypothetical protein